jgi:hypothetical protein
MGKYIYIDIYIYIYMPRMGEIRLFLIPRHNDVLRGGTRFVPAACGNRPG